MACNCEGNVLPNTQENLVAWVQPEGAGPQNSVYYAMTDEEWPALKITGTRFNRRGTITPIYRRSGRNPRNSIRHGSRTAVPAANTITLEFSQAGCGGFMPDEFIQCGLDIYQYHICCGGDAGDFQQGWSKIEVFGGVDIESDEYSDGVSYNRDDNADLFIRHSGEFQRKLTLYPMTVGEIALSAGLDSGANILSAIYIDTERCASGNCGDQHGCTDQWYSVTNEGKVIYKADKNSAVALSAIGSYPMNNFAYISHIGNRLFVSYQDGVTSYGFYWADINAAGAPGAWTKVIVGTAGFDPSGWLPTGSSLLLFGQNSLIGARIYEVEKSAAWSLAFNTSVINTGILSMITCGSTKVGVGVNGAIWISSCGNTFALAPSTPATNNLRAIAVRVTGEWWVGGNDDRVWITTNAGVSWREIAFPFSGDVSGIVRSIAWANPNVGYLTVDLASVLSLYTTWDGGKTWVVAGTSNSRINNNPAGTAGRMIAVPCCSNGVEESNNFLIAGIDNASGGALWQGQIQTC